MPIGEGTLIADKVRLIRLLGKGGMGSVWIGEHFGLDTHVAVKFMSAEHAQNGEALARFKREAAAAAKIRSPHVVQIFDHGFTTDEVPYIVMELLDGEDLMHRLQRAGPLPVTFVCDIVGQVCKALTRAHKLGIVHRDIKPENIFLIDMDGDRLVKVLDFGIAKGTAESNLSMTSTGAALGSPYYMSPEQIMSAKAVDPRSDLWSVGVVAYQALTGRLPFDGETVGALAVAINEGSYLPPSRLRPELSPATDHWFQHVFVKNPEGRFATAREMASAFEQSIQPCALQGSCQGCLLLFAEAQTSVAPFDAEEISAGGATPMPIKPGVRVPSESDQAATLPMADNVVMPVTPALANTHLTATLSGRSRQKPNPIVVGGIVAGVAAFLAIGALGLALFGSKPKHADPAAPALSAPTEALAVPAEAVQLPVAPGAEPSAHSEPIVAPVESVTAPTPKKKTSVARPQIVPQTKPSAAEGTTSKKKDRGF